MRILGFILLALGAVILAYGGITYSRERTIVDVGPFKATATEQRNVPFSPIIGAVLAVGGVLLLLSPKKSLTP